MTPDEAQQVLDILKSLEKQIEYEYRLYYNENGFIYAGTILKSDPIEQGKYIVTDKETYENSSRYQVVSGQLKKIEVILGMKSQIKKSTQGFRTVKNHPCLLLQDREEFDDIDYYDYTSN